MSNISGLIKEDDESNSNNTPTSDTSNNPTRQDSVTSQASFNTNQSNQLQKHVLEGVSRVLTELCEQMRSLSKQLKENDMRVVHLEQLVRSLTYTNQPVTEESSQPSNNTKKKRNKIKTALRVACWNKYAGRDVATTKAFCCRVTDICYHNFQCGHIVSHADGGHATLSNLRPICATCNGSMGRTNMKEFAKEHFDVDLEV
jgi:hypothetical protein